MDATKNSSLINFKASIFPFFFARRKFFDNKYTLSTLESLKYDWKEMTMGRDKLFRIAAFFFQFSSYYFCLSW